MPNFVTFDDGMNYVPISEIESFGLDQDENNKNGNLIKLRKGRAIQQPGTCPKLPKSSGHARISIIKVPYFGGGMTVLLS